VEDDDGLKRQYAIETLGVRMWHVSATDYYLLTEDSHGQLYDGDTYVVRWQYQIKQSGTLYTTAATFFLFHLPGVLVKIILEHTF